MPGKVTVACKLPHGLQLRIFTMEESNEPVMGGGFRKVKVARQKGGVVVLKGVASPAGVPKPLTRGYALTENVDAEFWDAWWTQNQEHDAVKNGMIFAHERFDEVAAQAKEHEATPSGAEPLNPKKDRRSPKVANLEVTAQTDE